MKFIVLFLFLFWGFLPVLPAQFDTGTRSVSARDAYEQGMEALSQQKPERAVALFIDAVQQDLNFVDAYIALGNAFLIMGERGAAIDNYKKALEIYPRSLEAHQQMAAAYLQQEEYNKAINQYRQLLIHYPGYPKAYDGMARTYYAQRNYTSAVVSAEQAMALYLRYGANREAANARIMAAQGSIEIGDYEKALKYVKACKKQMEGEPAYYYHLGFCYYKMGKKDKAFENLQLAENLGYHVPPYLKERLDNW